MTHSNHYKEARILRQEAIEQIGLGTVVHTEVVFDVRKNRHFYYDITSTAVLIVRAFDEPDFIITKYPARPSRIQRYWENAPEEIVMLSVEHTRQGLTF